MPGVHTIGSYSAKKANFEITGEEKSPNGYTAKKAVCVFPDEEKQG